MRIWQDDDNEKLFLSYQATSTANHEAQLRNLQGILWHVCESPIERKLLLGFLGNAHKIFCQFEFVQPDIRKGVKYGNVHLRLRSRLLQYINKGIHENREK